MKTEAEFLADDATESKLQAIVERACETIRHELGDRKMATYYVVKMEVTQI